MHALLSQVENETIPCVLNADYAIAGYRDPQDRPYWLMGSLVGKESLPVSGTTNLSWLEWDHNEVYLSLQEAGSIDALLKCMLGILRFWETEMKRNAPDVSFCMMASYDYGEPDEEDGVEPSVTLRFWADRGDPSVADTENLEHYAQPVLVQYVSKAAQRN